MASSPREDNRVPGLVAKSDADNTPVIVEADPVTKRLKVNAVITSGGSSGSQYTDGDAAIAHPIGTIPVFNKAGTITAVSDINPLPTSATVSTTGLATSAKQDTGNTSLASIDGKITAVNTGAVVVSSSALPTGAATSAKQPALGTAGSASADVLTIQGIASMTALKVDGSAVTQPVSLASVPSHAVTNAGTFAVQATEADGANTTLGAKADAKSTATDTTAISIMSVLKQISASVQAPPSQAVTNAGTFAVQATLAAETTKIIGAMNNLPATVDTNSGAKSASTIRVVLATDQPQLTNKLLVTPDANSAVNVAQIGGNSISTDIGASGNGTQRTVLANDTGRSLQSASGSASSSGNNTLVTAGANRLKVYAFTLSTTSATAVTCIFQSGASGTELWRVVLQAPTSVSTGANLVVQPPAWLFATASATLLNLNLSGAQTVHWSVSYWNEA